MGLFSSSTPFDADVERITNERNTSEDWGLILDVCDRVQSSRDGPRDIMKAVMRRMSHQDPHVVIQAITLLDALVSNCGKNLKLEVASRDFESEVRKVLKRQQHYSVQQKLIAVLHKWADNEFKGDMQLALIPNLVGSLRSEGYVLDEQHGNNKSKTQVMSKDPNVVSSQQEEDDIVKAIELSLQETKSSKSSSSTSNNVESSLYPSTGLNSHSNSNGQNNLAKTNKEEKRARALYDFEAAEDNELTFKTGEIVIVLDDSDVNWWRGSNHRGEGLFPANFVTTDLDAPSNSDDDSKQRRRSVQFNEEVEVKTMDNDEQSSVVAEVVTEINEEKIEQVLEMLNNADPTSDVNDEPELPGLESNVLAMGPLIDTELETVDRRLAQLTRLSTELVDALNLYHHLMHEAVAYNQVNNPAAHMMGGFPASTPHPAMYQYPVGVQQGPGMPQNAFNQDASSASYSSPTGPMATSSAPIMSTSMAPNPPLSSESMYMPSPLQTASFAPQQPIEYGMPQPQQPAPASNVAVNVSSPQQQLSQQPMYSQ